MTVEVRPLNVKCNIACHYCYQNSLRVAPNPTPPYDRAAIQATLENFEQPFSIFGGEPLLVSRTNLETFFRFGFEKYGYNSIQTNGTLIKTEHIALFKKYNVGVGISLDGPGELNDARWAGNLERTRALTQKTENAIAWLCREQIRVGLIITLHRLNATSDKLPILCNWIRQITTQGVQSVRLHLLEADNELVRQQYSLTPEQSLQALLTLVELQAELGTIIFDLFEDLRQMLNTRDDKVSCVWRACDTYDTAAVQSIGAQGQITNCGRTAQDGVDFLKSNQHGYERYLALYHTPQEYGGCQSCRFFLACKGYCPGTAIENDWRNRTEHCTLLMKLFEHSEQELVNAGKTPLSLRPDRLALEQAMLAAWASGENPNLSALAQSAPPKPAPLPLFSNRSKLIETA